MIFLLVSYFAWQSLLNVEEIITKTTDGWKVPQPFMLNSMSKDSGAVVAHQAIKLCYRKFYRNPAVILTRLASASEILWKFEQSHSTDSRWKLVFASVQLHTQCVIHQNRNVSYQIGPKHVRLCTYMQSQCDVARLSQLPEHRANRSEKNLFPSDVV